MPSSGYSTLNNEEAGSVDKKSPEEDDGDSTTVASVDLHNGLRNPKYAPADRYNLAFIIMVLLGMGGMYPWNFFVTAADYYRYSFRNITDPQSHTTYETIFENLLSVISTGCGFLALVFNTAMTRYLSIRVRVFTGFVVIILVFIATTVMATQNTDSIQKGFFAATMVDVLVISFASNVVNGALFGIQGCMPSRFATAMMIGQTLAGIFAALCSIAAVLSSTNEQDENSAIKAQATGYFASAIGATLLCTLAFAFFTRLPIVSFYLNEPKVVPLAQSEVAEVSRPVKEPIPMRSIIKRTWQHALTLILTFFVTLAVFPAIAASVRSTRAAPVSQALVNNNLFLPLTCFIIFNTGDLCGRVSHGFLQWPSPQQGWMSLGIAILRLGLLPMFVFCNALPKVHSVTAFGDIVFVVLMTVLSFTNGYLGNLGIMYGPKLVPAEHAEATGSFMGLCISTGLVIGAGFSFVLLFCL